MAEASKPPVMLVHRAIIINKFGNLLVVRRAREDWNNPDKWEFPGGKVDNDEIILNTLEREVKEETGVQIETIYPLVYYYADVMDRAPNRGMPKVVLFGLARALDTKVRLSKEHGSYSWVRRNDVENYDLTPECQQAIRRLGNTVIKSYIDNLL